MMSSIILPFCKNWSPSLKSTTVLVFRFSKVTSITNSSGTELPMADLCQRHPTGTSWNGTKREIQKERNSLAGYC